MNGAKAKLYYRNDRLVGIRYHDDDREPTRAELRARLPVGATLILVEHGGARWDVYHARAEADGIRLDYLSKQVGAALGLTVWDGAKTNGVEAGAYGADGLAWELGRALHGDPKAFRHQELRD